MVSPGGISFRRSTLSDSPMSAKRRAASSRLTSWRTSSCLSATMSRILSSIFARSSGVKARGKRKSYWNFSEWSLRPTSISASGKRRLTASASTCSALWRMNSPASGLLVVKMRKLPSPRSGWRRSTFWPFHSAPTASLARRGPIAAATASGVVPGATWRTEPSGSVRRSDSVIVSIRGQPYSGGKENAKTASSRAGRPVLGSSRREGLVGASGLEPLTSTV